MFLARMRDPSMNCRKHRWKRRYKKKKTGFCKICEIKMFNSHTHASTNHLIFHYVDKNTYGNEISQSI